MIKITKEEATMLNKKYGVPFQENGISHTYTRYKHYYLCENKKNLSCLSKVRSQKKMTTYEN